MENHKNIQKAFGHFGLRIDLIPLEDFLNINEFDVFYFGVSPVSVDILTVVKGLTFDMAFQNSNFYEIDDNLSVRGLSKSDLIKAKIAAGRNKDLDDIENLLNG